MGFPGSVLLNQGDIYKETSDKRYPLGTRGYTRDGRVFHYARNSSTALALPGSLLQMAVPTKSGNYSFDLAINAVPTSNSTSILITGGSTGSVAADFFNDGYLFTNDGTGQGQLVQVKDHGALTSGATAQAIYLHEEDKITMTITTATVCGLVPNIYDGVIIKPATAPTGAVVGVNPIKVTGSYYFWCQTAGPCPVTATGALVFAKPVVCSTSGAGSCAAMTTATALTIAQPVGTAISLGQGAGDCGLVLLQIAP